MEKPCSLHLFYMGLGGKNRSITVKPAASIRNEAMRL